jgi:hypothetical protein
MKNFVRPSHVLFAITLLSPAAARAAVVWTATFEKGDLSEWTPGINGTKGTRKNVEVLGEKVRSGSYAGKITVHPDDTFTFDQNRVDIQHQSTLTGEGKDSYLSGHYMMPEDAKVRNQIGFYESNKSFQNVMDLWVEPKAGGGTTINFAIGFIPDKAQWTADFKAGEWHQIAIHVHWSSNAANGYVELWFDGVKAPMTLKGKTRANDTDTLFYQTGLHRKKTVQFTDVIYLDDFIEADTEAEAKIAAPTQGGGNDGGVSPDATGAAGTGATGAAGTTGTAGTNGAAGTSGAAGTGAGGTTGAAGTSAAAGTSGAAGTGTTGAAGTTSPPREESSSGCAFAGGNGAGLGGLGTLSALALIATALRGRRKRCSR